MDFDGLGTRCNAAVNRIWVLILTEFDYSACQCVKCVCVCVHVVDRNYHVFYYLLAGCSETERDALLLSKPHDYFYLNQVCVSESVVSQHYSVC